MSPVLSRRTIIKANLIAAALLAMPGAARSATVTISGTVTYRERIALPPDAGLRVGLHMLDEAGRAGKLIAETTVSPVGQVPISFQIVQDAAPDGDRIGLVCSLSFGGGIRFATPAPVAVESNAGPVEIVLRRTNDETRSGLFGISWTLTELAGTEPLTGHVPTLTVNEDGSAGGHAGCNSYFAAAAVGERSIGFSDIGSTFIACAPDVMEQERAFLDALGRSAAFEIDDARLTLLDDAGAVLALFEAAA